MNKRRLCVVSALLVFLLFNAGCKSDGNYYLPSTNQKEYKVELLCELDWAARMHINRLFFMNNHCIVLGFENATQSYIHTYSMPHCQKFDCLNKGRGDNELLFIHSNVYIQDGLMYLYDRSLMKALVVNVDTLLASKKLKVEQIISIQSRASIYERNICDIEFSSFLSSPLPGKERYPRFRTTDLNRSVVSEEWNWPLDDYATQWAVYQHQIIRFSPDGRKFVIGTILGCGIIETYCYPSLDRMEYKEFFVSDFSIHPTAFILKRNQNTRDGFIDICTTNSEIWAIWDGATDWSVPDEERPYPTMNTIAVFDWDLNLKRTIKLDYNVLNLAYDETSNVLYLVAVSKSGDKYLGRVNLN